MSEPAEAAAVARKLLEVISHPLHELSTPSRGAVVSSLCFSWVTLFTPAFSDLGLLSRTVCSPRIQNKGFRIPGWRRKQRKPSSPQKPVSGKELPLTFHQPSMAPDPLFSGISVPTVCPKPGETFRLKGRYLLQSLKQYRDASLARLVGEQVAG